MCLLACLRSEGCVKRALRTGYGLTGRIANVFFFSPFPYNSVVSYDDRIQFSGSQILYLEYATGIICGAVNSNSKANDESQGSFLPVSKSLH